MHPLRTSRDPPKTSQDRPRRPQAPSESLQRPSQGPPETIFGPFLDHFGPFLDHFGPFWTILDHFGPFWTISSLFQEKSSFRVDHRLLFETCCSAWICEGVERSAAVRQLININQSPHTCGTIIAHVCEVSRRYSKFMSP